MYLLHTCADEEPGGGDGGEGSPGWQERGLPGAGRSGAGFLLILQGRLGGSFLHRPPTSQLSDGLASPLASCP